MIGALCEDRERLGLITRDILQMAAEPGSRVLIVSERIKQLTAIGENLEKSFVDSELVTSEVGKKQKKDIFKRFDDGTFQVILTTNQAIEGLDINRANRLFVVCPIKFGDYLGQSIGKLLASNDHQIRPVIFDYIDHPDLLKKSFQIRLKLYRMLGAVEQL